MKLRLIKFISLTCFCWMLLYSPAFQAQNVKQYDDHYVLDDSLSGKARFEFYKKNKDTIKHGKFRFQTGEYNAMQENLFTGMEVYGTFRNDQKHGPWEYRFTRFNIGKNPELKGYDVVFPGNGTEYLVSAGFKSGTPRGNWYAIERTINNGRPNDTLFFTEGTFKSGRLNGPIKAYNSNKSLKGMINEKGFLNGSWSFSQIINGDSLEDRRIYKNGVLKNHFFIINNDTLALQHTGMDTTVNQEEETWEDIPADSLYFKMIDVTSSGIKDSLPVQDFRDSTGFTSAHANAFVKKALSTFRMHNDQLIWNMTSGNDSVQLPKVKARKYPYSKGEQARLQQIIKRYDSIKKRLSNYFEDAQIDISRHAYEDVKYYYEVMKLYQSRLNKLESAVSLFSLPAFEYIDREAVMPYIVPDIQYPDSLSFDFEDKKHTRLPGFPDNLKKGGNLDSVYSHLNEINTKVKETAKEVNRILKEYRKEKRLAGMEEQLINARDTVMALFNADKTHNGYNHFHKKVGDSVRRFYEKAFKDYATMSLEAKINKVEDLIDCYKEGLNLYNALKDLPGNLEHLDKLYTSTTWNPYTFTHMDERIKKPLYRSFDNKLMPYLLKDLQQGMECGQIKDKAENFELLYNKMVDLREQDTEFIENEIKRKQSSKEIISVLDINLNIN